MCALLVIGFVWKVVRSKTASELLWYNRELAIQKDLQGSWELNVSELVSLAFFLLGLELRAYTSSHFTSPIL
jgi:hypothetical protein